MIAALIRRSVTHGKAVLITAAVALVALFMIGSAVADRMTNDSDAPGAESVRAAKMLNAAAGMSTDLDVVAIVSPKDGIASEQGRRRASAVSVKLFATPGVANVQSYLNSDSPTLISKDGKSALVTAQFKNGVNRDELAKTIQDEFQGQSDVDLGGVAITGLEIGDRVRGELGKAELFALPILFLLALWIFRGVVAACVTIGIGILSIVSTLAVLRGIVEFTTVSSFVLNLVTGLGLGLAIDYCLFIISRYREETVRYGYTPKAALVAGITAGRTVLFSALTVAASLSALMIFPQTFLRSMGIGGAAVTLVAATVTIVVLPAILAVLGKRIDALSLPGAARAREKDTGDVSNIAWHRLAKWVMRHAVPVLIACIALVGLLAWPAIHTKFSNINVDSLPTSSSARMASERITSEFPGSGGTTMTLAVVAPQTGQQGVADLAAAVAKVPNVQVPGPPAFLGKDTWAISAVVFAPPFSDMAQNALAGVRGTPSANEFLVGGETAAFVDNEQLMLDYLPMAAVVVGLAVLVVIFLLTGSVVLSFKTLLVNVLNVTMTIGVLVWVFQEGHFEGVLGYSSTGAIDLSQPILVAVFGFGLSTDYGVFLLARIKESFDGNHNNVEAVATGVGRSGRIISSAAILLCVAVGAFSTSSVLFIKQLGVGTAVSVLLDATIIRAFLVPAAMRLMSTANWWAPAPLRRLHAKWGISEAGPEFFDPVPTMAPAMPPKLRLIPSPEAQAAPVLTLVRSPEPAGEPEAPRTPRPVIVRQPTPPEVTGEHPVIREAAPAPAEPAPRRSGGKHRR